MLDIRQWGWEYDDFYWMVDGRLKTEEETIAYLEQEGYEEDEIESLLKL